MSHDRFPPSTEGNRMFEEKYAGNNRIALSSRRRTILTAMIKLDKLNVMEHDLRIIERPKTCV